MERLELYDHGLLDSLGVLDSGPPYGEFLPAAFGDPCSPPPQL